MLLNRKSKSALKTPLCFAALALLALLALSPIMRGKIPTATQSVFFETPWEDARPVDISAQIPNDATAQAARFYPWLAYISHADKSDDSILWNPLEGCGAPFMAQWRTRCFSPFSLPFYLFALGTALQWSAFLKLVVAGWCAFHAARKLGFDNSFAFVVGVGFQFCGHVYLWLNWPVSDVAPWLPLLMLFVERILVGRRQYWPWCALIVALMALGGDPETLLAALLFAAIYFIVRSVSDRRVKREVLIGLGAFAASIMMGLAITAFQILPYMEFLRETVRTTQSGVVHVSLRDFITAFLPGLFGEPSATTNIDGVFRANRTSMLLCVGLVQLWALPLWSAVRSFVIEEQRRRIEALLLAAFIMTALALAPERVLSAAPLFRHLRTDCFFIANAFAFTLMTASAADEWLVLNADQCKVAIKRLLLGYAVLIAAGAILLIAARGLPRPEALSSIKQITAVAMLFAAFLGLLATTLFKPYQRLMSAGLVVLMFLCAQYSFRPGLAFAARNEVFPETEFIKSVAESAHRVGGSQALKQWPLAGNFIPQIYSPAASQQDGRISRRLQEFIGLVDKDPLLLRRAGVDALLLGKEDIQGPFAPIRPTLAIQQVFSSGAVLFKDLDAKPRAWVAYDWRTSNGFEPSSVSSGAAPLIEGAKPPAGAKPDVEAKVEVSFDTGSDKVEIDVDSPLPGMLILADAFYPGWRAKANDQDVDILPADAMFRAIPISEGKQKVVFSYEPTVFLQGLIVSAASLTITLIALRRVARKQRYAAA